MTIPFTGELMTCVICGAQERSNPAIESQWRAIEVDGKLYYACPNEFPPDVPGSKDDFKTAYQLIFAKILINEVLGSGHREAQRMEQEFQHIYQRYQTRLAHLRRNHGLH